MATNKRKKASRKRKTAAMSWLWEFSKKVVWTVTILYAVSFVFSMLISWQEVQFLGNTAAITTLITEANETFRVVVGGYMINEGVENACKIVNSNRTEEIQQPASEEAAQG